MFAAKGKLELTLGVAIGSSTQIALMVLPLLVLLGWMMDERLDLDIGLYESFTLFVTVLMVRRWAGKDTINKWKIKFIRKCTNKFFLLLSFLQFCNRLEQPYNPFFHKFWLFLMIFHRHLPIDLKTTAGDDYHQGRYLELAHWLLSNHGVRFTSSSQATLHSNLYLSSIALQRSLKTPSKATLCLPHISSENYSLGILFDLIE